MISIENVSKNYGSVRALDHVTMELHPGEIVALLGENGAGKTTLMKSILGYLKYKGDITLDGEKITRKNLCRISFATCEHSFFPGLTAEEHGQFYKEHFPKFKEKRFQMLMEFFHLPMHKAIRYLSTGQQNQFEVIMALCQGAEYILMDEPFAGNDVFNREDFYKVLLGVLDPEETILISTHLIEEVSSFVSRAVFIRNGSIIDDVSMEELEEKSLSLMDYTKQLYDYKEDRVLWALKKMEEG